MPYQKKPKKPPKPRPPKFHVKSRPQEEYPLPPVVAFALSALKVNPPKCGPTGMKLNYQLPFAVKWITKEIEEYVNTQIDVDLHRGKVPRVSLPKNVKPLSTSDFVAALAARHAIILMEDYLKAAEKTRGERNKRIVSLRLYDYYPAVEKVAGMSRDAVVKVVKEAVGPQETPIPTTRGPEVQKRYLELARAAGITHYPNALQELKELRKQTEEEEAMAMAAKFVWGTIAIHMTEEGPFDWTHQQVANWLGVDRSTISRLVKASQLGIPKQRLSRRLSYDARDISIRAKRRRRRRLRLEAKGIKMKGQRREHNPWQ